MSMSSQISSPSLVGRVLVTQALGLGVALMLSLALRIAVPTTAAYTGKVALVFVVISAIVISTVDTHHPFQSFGAANQVTTFRAALVALSAGFIGEAPSVGVAWAAATLGFVAATLDGVDGWLARRTSMSSPFGARYDMELDAFLILVLAVVVWQSGKAGAWILLAGAMRYLFVAASLVWRWLDSPLRPSVRRKTVCAVQIVGLGVVVSPFVSGAAGLTIAAGTLALLAWSFGVDILWLRKHGG
jgi:phosphatidylglycerophosphate synthase